jgi:hypothetical protein
VKGGVECGERDLRERREGSVSGVVPYRSGYGNMRDVCFAPREKESRLGLCCKCRCV